MIQKLRVNIRSSAISSNQGLAKKLFQRRKDNSQHIQPIQIIRQRMEEAIQLLTKLEIDYKKIKTIFKFIMKNKLNSSHLMIPITKCFRKRCNLLLQLLLIISSYSPKRCKQTSKSQNQVCNIDMLMMFSRNQALCPRSNCNQLRIYQKCKAHQNQ